MPDPSREPARPDEPPAGEGDPDGRGWLGVPEWVSEMRKLYVEPKTSAQPRQEAELPPPKRRRGLPGGRVARPESAPNRPDAPGAFQEHPGGPTVGGEPPGPDERLPMPAPPRGPLPPPQRSPEPNPAPDRAVEEKVGSWLTSYLAATGHAPDRHGNADDHADDHADGDAEGDADGGPRAGRAAASSGVENRIDRAIHPRSLAELAARSEPERSGAAVADLHNEPGSGADHGVAAPAADDIDGTTVAATTDDATTVDAATGDESTAGERTAGAMTPDPEAVADDDVESSVEHTLAPGRPSTVPPVTLSWRDAGALEIGIPDVEDAEQAIVVEPPSQLVAQARRRSPAPDARDQVRAKPEPAEPSPVPVTPEELPTTRTADAIPAADDQSGWLWPTLILALVLVILLGLWYFLLREDPAGVALRWPAPATMSAVVRSGNGWMAGEVG